MRDYHTLNLDMN